MTSIRHTRTLFEYDGPQLFEARDEDGALFLALMIGLAEGRDRYLVVEVAPDRLEALKAGTLDLQELIVAAGSERWYMVWSSDLTSPLHLEPMSGPIPAEHLPEEGFQLGGAVVGEESPSPPADSDAARKRLVQAVNLDLVGPWAGHRYATERLRGWTRPSNWYLTGFLIPASTPPEAKADRDEDDDLSTVPEDSGLAEESAEDRKTAKKGFFPSSIGLSFLADEATEEVSVLARWGDYERRDVPDGRDGGTVDVWQRQPREELVAVALGRPDYDVPSSGGLKLRVAVREIDGRGHNELPAGTKSVSVFLVNERPADANDPDRAYAFQAELEVRSTRPFVPRPDLRGAHARDWDEQMADLHYADTPEYATGHGVSADWDLVDDACHVVRSTWIPKATVERTETVPVSGATTAMEELGELIDGDAAATALTPLVDQYRSWIDQQQATLGRLSGERRDVAEELLRRGGVTADRMEKGVEVLVDDPDALDAFRVANRAVAEALRQRLADQIDEAGPAWRAFQLAFILVNIPGVADPTNPERDTVDLLFFPTGGGKTEAYLGLAAFAMVLRRLRNPSSAGLGGSGVAVIMRYTLRLLTLDQLGRAAGLVCALELEREDDPERYGEWPFEIGLWVGKAATPNFMGRKGDGRSDSARSKTTQFKANPQGRPPPIPLENCPWCGERFGASSFNLLPNSDKPTELRVSCTSIDCDFSGDRSLPIVAVDESIYRRLPAFLIATVDKFASLPWTASTGVLLGGADRHGSAGFYGAAEPGFGQRLPAPLAPPDLVIQDELHLISGPLGTMVGLYEATIEALCTRPSIDKDRVVRPKIVASTATVRQAGEQVQALFGRPETEVFPPPGPNRHDSFFARTASLEEKPGRLYLGVAAPGRNPKVLMRRTWLALMGAAERAYRDAGGHRNTENPVDPYMTVLGYFNSLKELGGARRILEEEVQNTVKQYGERRRVGERRGLFQDRRSFSSVVELTSRVSTDKVAEARRRLDAAFHKQDRVDCAIATNMISVGLDIQRLGLMVVLGQPKTHAEYIQATSRVGRDEAKPGLVVTLLSAHKPRDRSHYERFRHYHETFYRSVEVSSVTPFSARALDRGFAGAMVGLARHVDPRLTPPRGVEEIGTVRASLEEHLRRLYEDRLASQPFDSEEERAERRRSVTDRIGELLDAWLSVLADYHSTNTNVQYQKYENRGPKPLLREMLDKDFDSDKHRMFRANRSLRDVEPEVNLDLRELTGGRTAT